MNIPIFRFVAYAVTFAAIVIVLVASGGCSESPEERRSIEKRLASREQLFKECMELAAKMPRLADDDVSDIVSECSDSSNYMTWEIK